MTPEGTPGATRVSLKEGWYKSTRNSGTPWTAQEVKTLRAEAKGNMPTRVIGLKHGRTEAAIYAKASSEEISLEPTNQSPYGTKQ